MKRLFFTLLLLISARTYAQIDGNYNYSLGVKAFNLVQMPKILQQANNDDFTKMWGNAGIVRFNDNQISFRISGHYFYKNNITFNNQCDNCETATGDVSDYAIKLGFEKNFNYAVIQPYVGADLGFRSNRYQGKVKQQNPNAAKGPYFARATKNGATISPILGLKLNVHKQVSIFAESSIEFYYAYERQETVISGATDTRTFAKYNKLESLLNPVAIGVQIHFSGNN